MSTYTVTVVGNEEVFHCAENTSLLVAMSKLGKNFLPVGCRAGGCGVCKIRIVSGDYKTGVMSLAQVTDDERGAGLALACKVFPRSDMLVEPYIAER